MIAKNLDNINLEEFPVVIFGSGPAGLTTALELEKKKIKCLVIEAGEEDYSKVSQNFYSSAREEIVNYYSKNTDIISIYEYGRVKALNVSVQE